MWRLIEEKMIPPTRTVRYCCQVLKETSTPNRMAVIGVRAAESTKRQGKDVFGIVGSTPSKAKYFSVDHTEEVHREAKDRDPVWDCTLIKNMRDHKDSIVNHIYDWKDADIWEYIRQEKIEINPLYEKGYKRVGCIGCPMASYSEKMKEFSDYPKYKEAYIRAFQRAVNRRVEQEKPTKFTDGQAVFDWWVQEYKDKCRGQMTLDDYV